MGQERDERIAAWMDGMMSDAQAAAFEAEMEADPALAEEVRRLMENDQRLRDAIPEKPVGDDLMAKFGLGDAQVIDFAAAKAAKAKRDKAEKSLKRPPSTPRWRLPAIGLAAAAVIAVIVVSRPPSGLEGQVEFQMAMQSLPSNASQGLTDGSVATPRLTFTAGDGRYCREFAVVGNGAAKSGVACKGDRLWTVEALVKGAPDASDPDAIRTAGGADGASLDSTYNRLKAKDPVSAQREKDLISAGWK